MSNIKFEVVDKVAQRKTTWLDELVEVAKGYEGKSIRINVSDIVAEYGYTQTSVLVMVRRYARALRANGVDTAFRNVNSDNPTLYITYNKPITESEG